MSNRQRKRATKRSQKGRKRGQKKAALERTPGQTSIRTAGLALFRAESQLLDSRTHDMSNGDMRFLDVLRVRGGHVQQQIHFVRQCAAGFAGPSHTERTAPRARFDAAQNVDAVAAVGKRYDHV